MRRLTSLCIASLLCLVIGCGDPPEPTGTVGGTLKVNGETYTKGLMILLTDQESGRPFQAKVDSSGAFKFEEPVPVASYKVSVTPVAEPPKGGEPPKPIVKDKSIPEKFYNDFQSDQSVEVKEGENSFDLDLK